MRDKALALIGGGQTVAMVINSSDFRPLDTFRRRWRWTDPRWALLPPSDLAKIHPLIESKAMELWDRVFPASEELLRLGLGLSPIARHLRLDSYLRFQAADPKPTEVSRQLKSLEPANELSTLVSWHPAEAVVVDWRVFVDYWNTFCYPASDDITIAPLNEMWILEWHHDEYFLFARVATDLPLAQ
jgi:hypothetical protein